MSKYNNPLDLTLQDAHVKILNKIKPGSRVLEFGPAHGAMTQYMQEQLNCRIYAVELDAQAAMDAKQYCEKILVGNIEEYQWKTKFRHLKFDYIIFADVLEHLYNPWQVLSEVKPFLMKEGRILISIPNIAHNAIIMNLINDKFEYRPTGLLDDTHIRFFTKSNIDKMIKEGGYKSIDIDAIFIKPQNSEFQRSYLEFNQGIVNSLSRKPNGHVYQYIYELVDANSPFSEYHVDELKEPLTIEIFYDTGNDFNQQECLLILSPGKHTVALPNVEIRRLRIDPSPGPGILKKYIVKVADSKGVIYECKVANLIDFNELSEGQLVCLSNDPQIIIDLPIANPVKLMFDIDYREIYFSKDIFTEQVRLNQLYDEQTTTLLEEKNTLELEIANKKREIENIKIELYRAKQDLEMIHAKM